MTTNDRNLSAPRAVNVKF